MFHYNDNHNTRIAMASKLKIWNPICSRWEWICVHETEEECEGGGSVGGCTDVTYDELVAKIGAEELICGSYYNITDFATVHWMVDSEEEYILDGEARIVHTGETEPLVVFATSASTLAEEAYSPAHPEDVIRYDWDSDRWQDIPAFYDGNASEVVDGWKGVIYRREDNITGNRCNFDFREITYRVWNIEQEAWDELTVYTAEDFVQVGTIIYVALDTSTDVEPGVDEGWEDYWKVVIDLDDGNSGTHSYFVLDQNGWYSGIVEDNIPIVDIEDYVDRTMFDGGDCYYNVFDEYFENLPYTIFGTYCSLNTFGADCGGNTFGIECYYNTFGADCYSNTFGAGCEENTFGTYCRGNTFGTDCYRNTFGTDCGDNTFGTDCYGNTFGTECRGNTFGTNCGGNTFGANCEDNTFGANCGGNTFGADCGDNTFGADCGSNTFGTSCVYNTFGAYCENNTFGTGCGGNTFGTECYGNTFGASCQANTFPTLARYNEFKNNVSSLDCSAFTAVYDTNVTHQIGTSGTIYQTYIDESGTPAMVISTEKIGIYSD